MVRVGNVSYLPYPVSQHRQVFVHCLYGHHLRVAYHEWSVAGQLVYHGLGQTGELVVIENIVVVALDGDAGLSVAVKVHLAPLDIVE